MVAPLIALPALALLSSAATPQDELPIDTWIDRVEKLEAITFRYRSVGAVAPECFFEIALGGPTRAGFDYTQDGDRLRAWVGDGVLTSLVEKGGEPPTFVKADFGAVVEPPVNWLDGAIEALGLPDPGVPPPRAQLMIWPAGVEGRSWICNLSCSVTNRSPFAWLERLRDMECAVEEVDDGYLVRLDDGAEFLLDGTLGFVRRVVLDHEDVEAGMIELVEVEVNGDEDTGLLTPDIPDDAEEQELSVVNPDLGPRIWRMVRDLWSASVVKAERDEAGFLDEHGEVLAVHIGEYYVQRFAVEIEGAVDRTKAYLDEQIDHLLGAWARSTDREADRPRFDAATRQLAKDLETDTQRAAEATAERIIAAPPPTLAEDAALDRFLEIERKAAARALREAFYVPSKAYMDERLTEAEDDGGRR